MLFCLDFKFLLDVTNDSLAAIDFIGKSFIIVSKFVSFFLKKPLFILDVNDVFLKLDFTLLRLSEFICKCL